MTLKSQVTHLQELSMQIDVHAFPFLAVEDLTLEETDVVGDGRVGLGEPLVALVNRREGNRGDERMIPVVLRSVVSSIMEPPHEVLTNILGLEPSLLELSSTNIWIRDVQRCARHTKLKNN